MKSLRKGLSWLLTIAMVFTLFIVPVSAADPDTFILTLKFKKQSGPNAYEEITSVAKDSAFLVELVYSGNPEDMSSTAKSLEIWINYTSDVTANTASNNGYVSPTGIDGAAAGNAAASEGTSKITWTGTNGMYPEAVYNEDLEPIGMKAGESGSIGLLRFKAAESIDDFNSVFSIDEASSWVHNDSGDNIKIIVAPSITASVKSGKTIYDSSSEEDIASMLEVTYIDETGASTAVDSSDVSVEFTGNLVAGADKTITVSANGFSTQLVITPAEDKVKSIAITSQPTKMSYTYGEGIDYTGMVVTATRESGATKTVTPTEYSPAAGTKLTVAQSGTTATVTYGTLSVETGAFTVNAKAISTSDFTVDKTAKTYTGGALTTTVESATLTADVDYTVSYSNNTNAGSATVTITGKGNYTGTVTENFAINAKTLEDTDFTISTSSQVYTGEALTTTVGSTLNKDTDYEVSYSNNINAGTATVTVTGKGNYDGTVTKNFTIEPADYAYTVTAAQDVKVGSGLSAINVPVKATGVNGEELNGTVAWFTDESHTVPAQDSDLSALAVNGTKTLYWVFTPAAGQSNYATAGKTGSVAFTIVEGDPQTITFTSSSVSKTYGDAAFTNAIASVKTTGDADVTNYGSRTTYESSNTGVATIDANGQVTIVGPGTATIKAKIAAVPGQYAAGEQSYTLTVAKKELSVTWSGYENLVYDGNAKTVTASPVGLVGEDVVTVTVTNGDQTNAGTYTATASGLDGADKDNYKLPDPAPSQKYTIAPKELTVTWSGYTGLVYSASAKSVTAFPDGLVVGDVVTVTVSNGDQINAGTYTATASGLAGAAAANYKLPATAPTQSYTIAQKPVTIADLGAENKKYNGTTAATATGGTIEGNLDGENLTIVAGTANFASADASDTAISVTFAGYALGGSKAANYILSAQPASTTAKISKADAPTLSLTAVQTLQSNNITTDSKDYTLPLSTLINGIPTGENPTFTQETAGTYTTFDGTKFIVSEPQDKDVTDSVVLTVAFKNYESADVIVNFKFADKIDVSDQLTLTGGEFVYNGEAHTATVGKGTLTAEPVVTYTDSIGATVSEPINVGTYTASLKYEDDVAEGDIPGHIGSKSATITITKAPLTINAEDKSMTFGGSVPALTYTATGLVEGESLTGELTTTATSASTVGSYDITQGTLTATANYEVTFEKGTLTISAKPIAESDFVIKTADLEYAAAALTPTVEPQTGLALNTDYTVAYENNIIVGTATVTVSGKGNYGGTISKNFNIVPFEAALAWDGYTGLVYDGNAKNVSATVTNLLGSDTCDVTVTGGNGVNAGSYTATATALTNENYKLPAAVTQAYTISKAARTTTVTGAAITLDKNNNFRTELQFNDLDAEAVPSASSSNESVVTVDGITVVAVATGSAIITVDIPASDNYDAVTGLTFDVSVVTADDKISAVYCLDDGSFQTVEYAIGDTASEQPKDSRSGYNFSGWSLDGSAVFKLEDITKAENAGKIFFASPVFQEVRHIPSTPRTPGTESVTVKGSTATVKSIDTGALETGKPVTLDFTQSKTEVKEVQFAAETVKAIAEASDEGVEIKLADAEVKLDAAAMESIAAALNGADMSLVVNVGSDVKKTMTSEQNKVIGAMKDTVVISASITSGGKNVSDFGGGSVDLTVDYKWNSKGVLRAAFIAADGTVEFVPVRFEDGKATITVKHFSDYVIYTEDALPFEDVADSLAYYYAPVKWAVENVITSGVDDTHFAPFGIASRAQMVTFLWKAAGSPEPTAAACEFTDVSADAYYYKAVLWAVEKGITKGTGDTTFSPDKNVTRAQAVSFLYRFSGSQAVTAENIFTDVKKEDYYYDAVLWAIENGITIGTGNDKFSPADDCLRCQIVTFLYNYFAK